MRERRKSPEALSRDALSCAVIQVAGSAAAGACMIHDAQSLLARRYDGREGTCYLFRPDQHVCARWRSFDLASVRAAIARAAGHALH